MTASVRFSLLTPVYDPDPLILREYLDSVLRLDYQEWELCLVDDGSEQPAIRAILQEYSGSDARIRTVLREGNGGISAASNDALGLATGDWVLAADQDDIVAPDLLRALAAALDEHPDADVLYTDEDKFDRPFHHFDAFHKPGWSPEALLSQMYAGHVTAYRRELVVRLGGFRPELDGAQDWDLLLRATEVTQAVHHVPQVLYHWRSHAQSTARGVSVKAYALEAGRRALSDALARRGIDGRVEDIAEFPGYFQVRRNLEVEPLVSVVIPTVGTRKEIRGAEIRLVDAAVHSLVRRNDYPNVEIVVVLGEHADPEIEPALRALVDGSGCRIEFVQEHGRFDFSKAVNRGVARASGPLLLLLNDDVEAVRSDWLRLLVEAVQDPEVGVAGSRLLYEDGRVQHAGVAHNVALPFHPHRGDPDGVGYFGELAVNRNYLAVTGACLMTTRAVFTEVGGLSPLFPVNYNDIDYCLKVIESKRRVVYVGQSVLHHYESASRQPSVTTEEIVEWRRWWVHRVADDPFLAHARIPEHAPR